MYDLIIRGGSVYDGSGDKAITAEFAQEHSALDDEVQLIAQVSQESGRPLTFTLFQVDEWSQKWREAIQEVKQANQAWAKIYPQVARGPRIPLESVIHKATRRNAQLYGFADKGLIAPGMCADLNVIDYANLKLGPLALEADLPGGGKRFLQNAAGYVAILFNGEVTRSHDQDTSVRADRLIRSS